HDLLSLRRADAMDVLQGDHHALIRRYVNTSDTGHSLHSCRQPTSVSPLSGCKSSINAHTTPSPVVGPGIVAALFAYWVPGIYGFHPGPSTSITAYSTISACCARPCAGLLLLRQDPLDRFGDVVDFGHAVHGPQGALVPVERDQWRGLRPIGLESLVQRRRVVVGPQRVAARRHLGDALFDALEQNGFVHLELDDRVEVELLAMQHVIQCLGLWHRAREAVEDE